MPKADGRRDNVPAEFEPVLRTASLPQSSLRDASSPIRWSRNWFAWERETWYDILLYFGMSFGVLIPNGNAKLEHFVFVSLL